MALPGCEACPDPEFNVARFLVKASVLIPGLAQDVRIPVQIHV